jgi:CheY-like chemotaxis protein
VLNGEEALVAVAQQRPDLTLMPIMDGCEATRRINAVPHAAIHSDYRGHFERLPAFDPAPTKRPGNVRGAIAHSAACAKATLRPP